MVYTIHTQTQREKRETTHTTHNNAYREREGETQTQRETDIEYLNFMV